MMVGLVGSGWWYRAAVGEDARWCRLLDQVGRRGSEVGCRLVEAGHHLSTSWIGWRNLVGRKFDCLAMR